MPNALCTHLLGQKYVWGTMIVAFIDVFIYFCVSALGRSCLVQCAVQVWLLGFDLVGQVASFQSALGNLKRVNLEENPGTCLK